MNFIIVFFVSVILVVLPGCRTLAKEKTMTPDTLQSSSSVAQNPTPSDQAYQEYIEFFEKVYTTMNENYYQEVNRGAFDAFIEKFKTKIYPQLKEEKKSDNYVRWRGASLLVAHLKSLEDVFSEFYPPKPAEEYKQTALGVRKDLGVTITKTDEGFRVTHVEPRSDAYEKGLREEDILTAINQEDIRPLALEKVQELLTPLIDTTVHLSYLSAQDKQEKTIDAVSKEFFQQTVFMKPTDIPFIYCVEIRRFNQKTAEDLFRFLSFFRENGPVRGLVIDLRGNPGGPPLAAREISSFFLPAGEEFAYFQKKNQPKSSLDVPAISPEYKYDGPIVILIDDKSGSSSELFSGTLQKRGRAILMGQNSAGQVMLKSMFPFEDESMLLLITARGHHPDGDVFSFSGLIPDKYMNADEETDIVHFAATYLAYLYMKGTDGITKAHNP